MPYQHILLSISRSKSYDKIPNAIEPGFISSVVNVSPDSPEVTKSAKDLAEVQHLLQGDASLSSSSSSTAVPVGMSCITGHESIANFTATVLPVIAAQRPAALWLFAPDGAVKPHGRIIAAVRTLGENNADGYRPRVFVQVGNLAAARDAVVDGADVIVCQGVDAGGHQFRKGSGVISFVPEVRRMLEEEFKEKEVALVAAGGIVNGKGVAAALALGMLSALEGGIAG